MTGPLTGIDVLLLAGGKGTRIKSVLGDTPKIMAPINGKTMLDRQLERLSAAGADRIFVSARYHLHHLAPGESAIDIGGNVTNGPPMAYQIIIEPRPLGTVAAVRFAAHLLYSNPVVIINGDTWADVDWTEYLKVWTVATDLAYAVDEAGTNAGHYMVSQRWIHALITSPYKLIEDGVRQTQRWNGTPASGNEAKIKIKIPSFIDIGTPEGLEKAREVIK